MADYTIDVGVKVEDSQLDALEAKINELKNKTINLEIGFTGTKQITKNVQAAVKAASKATEKAVQNTSTIKGTNLVEQAIDPDAALKSLNTKLNTLSKYKDNLNLGQVNLSINQSVISELDALQTKLNTIKQTAKNMGSIRLTIDDSIKTQNGKIVVGQSAESTQSGKMTLRQAQTQIKNNMKTIGTLNTQYANGAITKAAYEASKRAMYQSNRQAMSYIRTNGKESDVVTAATNIRQAQTSYRQMTSSAEQYGKVVADLGEKQKTFNKTLEVYNSTNDRPLNKTLGEGYKDRLNSFNDTYRQLKESQNKLSSLVGEEKETEVARFNALKSEANRQARQLSNVSQFFTTTPNKYSRSEYVGIDLDPTSDVVYSKMEQMASQLANGSKYTTEFNAAQGKMYATIDRGAGVFEKYQLAYRNGPGDVAQSLTKVTQSVKPLSSYITEMGQKFRSLSQYLVSNFGFTVLTTGIREGISAIKDLDTAMTELKKTSTGTNKEYSDFTAQAKVDAKEIGSTTVQIVNSAADWSRLGYTLKDSQIMAKNTGILKNVSEFESIEDATSSMVGIMQAYGLEANESTKLIDQLNQIGNNFSISTSGLAEGLQISGSALEVGGNSIEQSMALITAYNSSIQDVSQAARAARTVSMRMHGVDATTLAEEGEDVEGLIETVPKLEAEIKSLTAVNGKAGLSLTDATGRVKDDYTFLLELAGRWKEIEEADIKEGTNRQSKILEDLAGKNRANALASLLNNERMLQDVYSQATGDYQGSAQKELNKYLDSIEARTTKVKESWSQLWQSEGTTNLYKSLLSAGNGALELLNTAGLGNILSAVGGMAGFKLLDWGGTNYQLVL